MRQLDNGSRFALQGARRRLLRLMGIMPVRSGARRSFSPAFPVPLHSDRGSLARSRRLLVLVIASVFACERTLAARGQLVNSQMQISLRHPPSLRAEPPRSIETSRARRVHAFRIGNPFPASPTRASLA